MLFGRCGRSAPGGVPALCPLAPGCTSTPLMYPSATLRRNAAGMEAMSKQRFDAPAAAAAAAAAAAVGTAGPRSNQRRNKRMLRDLQSQRQQRQQQPGDAPMEAALAAEGGAAGRQLAAASPAAAASPYPRGQQQPALPQGSIQLSGMPAGQQGVNPAAATGEGPGGSSSSSSSRWPRASRLVLATVISCSSDPSCCPMFRPLCLFH